MRLLSWLVGEDPPIATAQLQPPKGPASPWQPQTACSFQRLRWQQVDLVPWNSVLVTNARKCENAAFWGCFRRERPAQGGQKGLGAGGVGVGRVSYSQEPWLWRGIVQGGRNEFPGCILGILTALRHHEGPLSLQTIRMWFRPPAHSHTHAWPVAAVLCSSCCFCSQPRWPGPPPASARAGD